MHVKVGHPPLVDVQQAPCHLASAEGDEREAAMTVGGDGHGKPVDAASDDVFTIAYRQFIVSSIALLHVNYTRWFLR